MKFTPFSLLALGMLLSPMAHAGVMWDESIDGSLSTDRFNPTAMQVGAGSNMLHATTGISDNEHGAEFYTIHLDANERLTNLFVTAYSGQDLMFIGMTQGTTFTVDPDSPVIEDLLGWTHFGPNEVTVDILPTMGSGTFGSQVFEPPLPAGDYSFWMNQFNDPQSYSLDFVVEAVPEPTTMVVLGLGVAAVIRRRKKA